jgi:hypothetical protein
VYPVQHPMPAQYILQTPYNMTLAQRAAPTVCVAPSMNVVYSVRSRPQLVVPTPLPAGSVSSSVHELQEQQMAEDFPALSRAPRATAETGPMLLLPPREPPVQSANLCDHSTGAMSISYKGPPYTWCNAPVAHAYTVVDKNHNASVMLSDPRAAHFTHGIYSYAFLDTGSGDIKMLLFNTQTGVAIPPVSVSSHIHPIDHIESCAVFTMCSTDNTEDVVFVVVYCATRADIFGKARKFYHTVVFLTVGDSIQCTVRMQEAAVPVFFSEPNAAGTGHNYFRVYECDPQRIRTPVPASFFYSGQPMLPLREFHPDERMNDYIATGKLGRFQSEDSAFSACGSAASNAGGKIRRPKKTHTPRSSPEAADIATATTPTAPQSPKDALAVILAAADVVENSAMTPADVQAAFFKLHIDLGKPANPISISESPVNSPTETHVKSTVDDFDHSETAASGPLATVSSETQKVKRDRRHRHGGQPARVRRVLPITPSQSTSTVAPPTAWKESLPKTVLAPLPKPGSKKTNLSGNSE